MKNVIRSWARRTGSVEKHEETLNICQEKIITIIIFCMYFVSADI
jgi:hypothetical protein